MTTREAHDSPGIPFPPPLVFVVPLALGFLAHRSWPMPIVPNEHRYIIATIGWAFVLVFVVLQFPAYFLFWRARTSLLPYRPATTVVEAGPYRWTRNPMYLSITALSLGVACVFNALWPLLLVPISVLITDRYIIAREEAYLERAFGRSYVEYKRRVRRWI